MPITQDLSPLRRRPTVPQDRAPSTARDRAPSTGTASPTGPERDPSAHPTEHRPS
jgi:hypothetical protein